MGATYPLPAFFRPCRDKQALVCQDGIWPPEDGSRQEDDSGLCSAYGQGICASRVHCGAICENCALGRPCCQELASSLLEGCVIVQDRKDDGALLCKICKNISSCAMRVAAIVALCRI